MNFAFNKLLRAAVPAFCLGAMSPLAQAFDYSYLEGGFVNRDSGRDDDAGARVAGSYAVLPQLAAIGEYVDTGDFEQLSAGVVFHAPIITALDFVGGATLEAVDGGNDDDTGLGLRAGVRWDLLPGVIEINPELRYVGAFEDDQTSLRVAGIGQIAPRFAVQAALQAGDDDRIELGMRYNFGNTVR